MNGAPAPNIDFNQPLPAGLSLRARYRAVLRGKALLLLGLGLLLICLSLLAIGLGSYDLSLGRILGALWGQTQGAQEVVIWNIRLPRIAAALAAGWALGLSGLITQTLLRNPLASPATLGISQGAAFGAAFSIVVLGAGEIKTSALRVGVLQEVLFNSLYSTAIFAFAGAFLATLVIMALARLKKLAPESIILAGVALSSLFVSGTILVQYFATETEIASVVFWTFGDVARAAWQEIGVLALVALLITTYFLAKRWDLNVLLAGEDTALGLGVNVTRLRLTGMFLAALAAALATAFLGVIAFLGLLAPHIGRRLAGPDHRLLIPYSSLIGALLLLGADTLGRVLVGSGALPAGVLTSFLGAPLFLYLLLQGRKL